MKVLKVIIMSRKCRSFVICPLLLYPVGQKEDLSKLVSQCLNQVHDVLHIEEITERLKKKNVLHTGLHAILADPIHVCSSS